jgi:chemotaxis protein methyltransferase CheR
MTAAARRSADEREFPFGEREFRFIASFVHDEAGIVLGESKKNMVYARLAKRLRELGLASFKEYCALLQGPRAAEERPALINAITTNLTKFFREGHHFEHLARTVLPAIPASSRLRIWSAGCSSGEEPYSIALTLRDTLTDLDRRDARILATDLDTNMVSRASAGLYPRAALEDVPARLRSAFTADASGQVRVETAARRLITFKPLNLLGPWPMQGPFDAIFCRNVMIYFDGPTKQSLVERYADLLKPGGWLYIGHSETLLDQRSAFVAVGRTIYRKAT